MPSNLLQQTRCYLSGPMDFVGSRVVEKYLGWRTILTPILKCLSISVLDPWNKPCVRGHNDDYGREGLIPTKSQYEEDFWTNHETRARFEQDFWETVHIDLRMTDISDFVVAFVPTNIYSVGTVHEVITARNQWKPVLLISPPIRYDFFPALQSLSAEQAEALKFYGLKENPDGLPSQWYGNIVGGHNMFDGFGWEHLDFKGPQFYEQLIESMANCPPPDDENPGPSAVADWVANFEPLQSLRGGILDHVSFTTPEEEATLETALSQPEEKERTHFWYNHAYRPRRPLLYHLFSIASG
ncbi:MAG: hypothetical protein AAF191_21655, partial [Verrucomicrobiota bacterium]